jgi:aldose 1-epimerase
MQNITLTHQGWHLELLPEIGGSIAVCAFDGQDVMRRSSQQVRAPVEARDLACFPLVPFSNRIANGLFEFEGRRVTLPRNMDNHPHAIHGQGWRGVWTLAEQTPERVVLRYRHPADAWPWAYEATQSFEPAPDSLIVRLSVSNLSDGRMPTGLGLHPYFPRSEGVSLTTSITHLWDSTSEQIPIRRVELPTALDFSRGLKIDDLDLDHCFAGWNRDAVIEWPGRRYRLHLEGDENLKHLVVYTPPGKDHFCVEGVENMNDAFNWMARGVDTGAHILAPMGERGSSHSITTVFRVERVPGT